MVVRSLLRRPAAIDCQERGAGPNHQEQVTTLSRGESITEGVTVFSRGRGLARPSPIGVWMRAARTGDWLCTWRGR